MSRPNRANPPKGARANPSNSPNSSSRPNRPNRSNQADSPRGRSTRSAAVAGEGAGVGSRHVAIEVLTRIETDGAYANLALGPALERSNLTDADKRFVTELVYGATRMRRACDAAVEPYLLRGVDPPTRAALRVGAYQLWFLRTPAHAAVSSTVAAVKGPARGLVNAVLRRVAEREPAFPDRASELSYPDWVIDRLVADLGPADAEAALVEMNRPASATERGDGYIQDLASQWVAGAVEASAGMVVVDLCAAPGGKATALAGTGAFVVAADVRLPRCRLMDDNAARLGIGNGAMSVVCADGARPPLRAGCADRVLVDAPCSGLGTLRRRADARWRASQDAVTRLAEIQRTLLAAALELVKPGGELLYSVCTLTAAETTGIDTWLASYEGARDFDAVATLGEPWRPAGRGSVLLPQAAGTDGMYVLRLRRHEPDDEPDDGGADDGGAEKR